MQWAYPSCRAKSTLPTCGSSSSPAAWRISPPAASPPSASANCDFSSRSQYISIDYSRQDVLAFMSVNRTNPSTPSVNPQIGMVKPPVTAEEPLHAELQSFLDAVRTRSKPVVPLADGRRALALALDIVAAIHSTAKAWIWSDWAQDDVASRYCRATVPVELSIAKPCVGAFTLLDSLDSPFALT